MSSTREFDWRERSGMVAGMLLIIAEMVLAAWWGKGPSALLAATGGILWLVGMLLLAWPIYYLKRHGGVAKGHSFVDTTRVVDTGIYAVIRHPQYLGWLTVAVALILRAQRLDVLALGVASLVATIWDFRKMDAYNIALFGDEYRAYMERVPGWNPIAGLWRLARRGRAGR